MKSKTIKAIIRNKIDSWLDSIEDETVKDLASKNTIVTGGCIASMLLKEKVNDYDLYFKNKETVKALAEYYITRFKVKNRSGIECNISVWDENDRIKIVIKSAGIASEDGTKKPYEYFESSAEGEASKYVSDIMQDSEKIEDTYEETENKALEVEEEGKEKYRPVFMSTNAITLSNKVQLVLRFYGEPEQIHENYDFVHCTNYWKSWDSELILNPKALEALLAKELIYVGSKYPVCSIFRMRKFINRGYTINAGQIVKMCMQISALDLTDIKVLEDQLTGVDCAYFLEVISKLKDNDPEKINYAYLVEVIDRMF
jgi:hypothetical protein